MSDVGEPDAQPADASPVGMIAANVRDERRRAGVSISALARRAGLSKSTLSQLEAGGGNPSVETLWAIATALEIPFSRLVATTQPSMRVIRAGEGPSVSGEGGRYSASLLSPGGAHDRRDLYVVALEQGVIRRAEAHPRGTVEHVVVASGRVRMGPVGQLVELGPGDYVTFPGDVAHLYEALEPGSWFVAVLEHATA